MVSIERILEISCDVCEDAFHLGDNATVKDAKEELRRYRWVTRRWPDGRRGPMHVCRTCAGRPDPTPPPP